MHDGLQLDGNGHFFCDPIRGFGLVEVSREIIEHVAAMLCKCLDSQRLSKDLKYQIVRYQVASTNVLDCHFLISESAAILLTQQLPAGEVRNPGNGLQARGPPACPCRRQVEQLTADA